MERKIQNKDPLFDLVFSATFYHKYSENVPAFLTTYVNDMSRTPTEAAQPCQRFESSELSSYVIADDVASAFLTLSLSDTHWQLAT